MVPHTCNSKTRQDEAGREFKVIMTLHSQVPGQLGLYEVLSQQNKTEQPKYREENGKQNPKF